MICDGERLYQHISMKQRRKHFDGRKLQEKVTTGEFLYEGGVLKRILFDGGYVEGQDTGPVYMF